MNYTLYRAESLTNMNTDALVRRKNRNCMKGAIKLSNHCILMRRRRYETIQDDRPLPAVLFHGQVFFDFFFFFVIFSPSFFPVRRVDRQNSTATGFRDSSEVCNRCKVAFYPGLGEVVRQNI